MRNQNIIVATISIGLLAGLLMSWILKTPPLYHWPQPGEVWVLRANPFEAGDTVRILDSKDGYTQYEIRGQKRVMYYRQWMFNCGEQIGFVGGSGNPPAIRDTSLLRRPTYHNTPPTPQPATGEYWVLYNSSTLTDTVLIISNDGENTVLSGVYSSIYRNGHRIKIATSWVVFGRNHRLK
jgi:hypothetical protein